jgi:hypothetical protein
MQCKEMMDNIARLKKSNPHDYDSQIDPFQPFGLRQMLFTEWIEVYSERIKELDKHIVLIGQGIQMATELLSRAETFANDLQLRLEKYETLANWCAHAVATFEDIRKLWDDLVTAQSMVTDKLNGLIEKGKFIIEGCKDITPTVASKAGVAHTMALWVQACKRFQSLCGSEGEFVSPIRENEAPFDVIPMPVDKVVTFTNEEVECDALLPIILPIPAVSFFNIRDSVYSHSTRAEENLVMAPVVQIHREHACV